MLIDRKHTITGSFLAHNTIKVLKPIGAGTFQSCPNLKYEVMEMVQANPDILILDLENIEVVSLEDMNWLVKIFEMMQINGSRLLLLGVNLKIANLLHSSKNSRLVQLPDHCE
jgi:anti-anti-sigma regulatory factor